MNSNRRTAFTVLFALGAIALLFGFQNCGSSFKTAPVSLESLNTPQPLPQPTPAPTPMPSPTNPPPQPKKLRIMPLGDSITYGIGSSACSAGGCDGYRTPLQTILTSENIHFDFVGSVSSGPDWLTDKDNEGHSGWRIDEIQAQIVPWLQQALPDVVLLHIGTNDIAQNHDMSNAGARLGQLIDTINSNCPNAYIFVALVIPIQNSPSGWDLAVRNYNTAVEAQVSPRTAQGRKIFLVNMYSHFDQSASSADYADPAHPSDVGYAKMAEVWNGAFYFHGLPSPAN